MEASRETFGNWRIGRHLGGGTWTEVVLAESIAASGNAAPVALKRLTRNGKRTADLVALFADECHLLRDTPPHHHLVKFLDMGTVGSTPWLSTEFVPAPTLASMLAANEPLSPVDLSAIVVDIGSALAHLHAQGVVHCDVSPSNILVAQGGAVLCDLGVATKIGQRANDRGTPGYMAPEQIIGEVVSPATDIFALATVWWEATNRARLFGGRPRELISHATMELPIEPPNDPFYGDVIMKALAREVASRPASIAEWMASMSSAGNDLAPESR